jgi:hypothetical protein
MTIDPFTARIAIAAAAALLVLAVWHWLRMARIASGYAAELDQERQPAPEQEPSDAVRQLEDRVEEWAVYADALEDRLAWAERDLAHFEAESVALRWRCDGLVADRRAMRSLLESQTRQHVAVMRLRAESEHGWTELPAEVMPTARLTWERTEVRTEVMERSELHVAGLADVIPITSEHRDLVERMAHRQRLEALRDDESVWVAGWDEPPLPALPVLALSREVA